MNNKNRLYFLKTLKLTYHSSVDKSNDGIETSRDY